MTPNGEILGLQRLTPFLHTRYATTRSFARSTTATVRNLIAVPSKARIAPQEVLRGRLESIMCTWRNIYTEENERQCLRILGNDEGRGGRRKVIDLLRMDIFIKAISTERVAVIAVRLELGSVGVEQRETIAILSSCKDLSRVLAMFGYPSKHTYAIRGSRPNVK